MLYSNNKACQPTDWGGIYFINIFSIEEIDFLVPFRDGAKQKIGFKLKLPCTKRKTKNRIINSIGKNKKKEKQNE